MPRFVWLLLTSLSCQASIANIYYASAAAGSNNGTSCANAYIYTDGTNGFNISGKWGAGATQIGQDTIVHVCGTITGSANSGVLAFKGDGASGHPITLLFESGSIIQSPVCQGDGGATGDGGCISMYNHNWLVVDGGNTGSATLGTLTGGGTIQNTDNGDSLGHHCGTAGSPTSDCLTTLIDMYKCSNCTIKNLKMLNTYVKVQNNVSTGVSGDQQHSNTMSGQHLTVTNNQIDYCGWCVFNNYGSGDIDTQVFSNDIAHFGHGMMYATAATVASDGLLFYGNKVHDPDNWTTPSCNFHNDGIHTFGLLSGSSMTNLYMYNNWFTGTWGHCATGFIYIEGGSSNPSHAQIWSVYNNVGDATTETSWANTNGWFGMFSGESGTQKVFNNTILGGGTTNDNNLGLSLQGLAALTVENNTISGFEDPIWISPGASTTVNNNAYGGAATCANGGNCFVWNGSFTGSFANWKSACSCDAAGLQQSSLSLNANGSPQSGSPLRSAAINLTASASGNLASLQNDTTLGGTRSALARPGSGAWDIGGFQFSAPPPPSTASGVCSGTMCSAFK